MNSPPTPRRFSILQRSSPVTTEIGLALNQYTTHVFSRTMTSFSVHYYPSLERTKGHPLPLFLVLQISPKVHSHLANTTGSFALFSQDYKPLMLRLVASTSTASFKPSTLTLLSLIDTSKSPTVLVTIHGPLGKIKVLALLDTGANANFIEKRLAKLIRLSTSGSLDVKVGNSTIIGAIPIL
ncbi:hypothetical protein DSO57_1006137 [Entomophthora muscae]|uniref:Uncharacterized protein n=1 Tax=Entomophthora muscae TaxID=34485 RepID=A0ACC2UHE1_9FUNG|nr:hypothetical protein DSO57_1006137 [Entomophthora muscae]